MSVKIRNIRPSADGKPFQHVRCEIDGHEIPELINLQIDCPLDGAVEIVAHTYATTPLDIEFEQAPNITIIRNDKIAREMLGQLLEILAGLDLHSDALSRGQREQVRQMREFLHWTHDQVVSGPDLRTSADISPLSEEETQVIETAKARLDHAQQIQGFDNDPNSPRFGLPIECTCRNTPNSMGIKIRALNCPIHGDKPQPIRCTCGADMVPGHADIQSHAESCAKRRFQVS